ncbi:DNA damage-induced apoptosis suppressor protein [Pantherophis guttatus]|uniref:DNA damage-induced apoptosis suppressor protein n=1 Tax=Pantherophis guttatus TaxID=94885 RepID=A0A6P9AY86_PANGU|nr:DNA damage-induced apoptosis suppressor protein [Pantherophis guttatus]XP_060542159.1 DNA damage-induced apoptosis suppressor protein [Pantherophis guttatus]XP_060542160.1 DNA damage-induced apoptosis suppressor protein [Pantherophis guttatus]
MNGGHFLVASVISIQNSSFVYPSCHSCFSKVSLRFKRYNCQKCACSGDTKEANYRYRLSLEVADTREVFEVTVFGSCLDTYFGVTAKGLQRYIEELNREAGEDENDAVFGAVFHAVETCFVGKKFVFRIKSSNLPYVVPSDQPLLQNGPPRERSTKALIACEMSLPHPGLVGYTVIHYIEQQRSCPFKQSHGALRPLDHVLASDHPSRELKSLHLSDDLDATQSNLKNVFLTLWPYSFGLTWSSTSSEDAEHSAALDTRQASLEKQKDEDGFIISHNQLAYNFRGPNSKRDKRDVHEGKKSCLYSSPQSLTTRDGLGSRLSAKGKDGDILEGPLPSEQKDSSCIINIQSSYGLVNPQHPLPHQRPKEHLASSSSPDATGGVTAQEASSEGLIEFLARLDNGNSTADLPNGQEQHPASVLGENKENELLAEEEYCAWRGRDIYCFPQVGSSCREANFDASADLFDISAGGSTKSTPATLRGPQIVTSRAGMLTPNCIISEFMPRQGKGNASWATSHLGLSLCDTMDVSVPKTSTPIAGSEITSECSPVGILDFTSTPRSIPFARPCHPECLTAGKGSFLSQLPLNKLPWDKARCKRSRLPSKNFLVKQLVSKFSPSARSSNAEAGTDSPCGPPSRLSVQESLSEDGGQEWSPPLRNIQDQDVKSWRRKRSKSFIRFHSDGRVMEDFPLSENQGGSSSPKNLSKLAKLRFLPKKQQPEEADVEGQPVRQQRTMLGPPVTESPDKPPLVDFSRSKLLPAPSPVPHVADWSSELFSDHDQLLNAEATLSLPTS